jgi:alcohol dehydrogenase, propanol-preferring
MLFDGSLPAEKPVVIGHEGVGFVEEMGKNVTGFKKGDRIGFLYIKGCCCKFIESQIDKRKLALIRLDECAGCQVHNLNCSNGTPMIQGFGCDGMFAEYTAIDRHK